MASKKKVRSIIALSIIVLLGLTGAGFIVLKLATRAPREVRAFREATILLKNSRFEEACAQAQKALNYRYHDVDYDVPARRIIAVCRVNLKQFDEARRVIKEGLTEERHRQYLEGLKFFQEQMGRVDPAASRAAMQKKLEDDLCATNAGYGEYLDLQILVMRVNYSQLQSLIGEHPSELTLTAEVQHQSRIRSQIDEMLNDSARTMETLVHEHPEDARIYQLLGELYKIRSQFVQASARAYLKEQHEFQLMDKRIDAASAQRRARDVWSELPVIWQRELAAFQSAVNCNPDSAESRLELANLLRWGDNPNYPRALAETEEIIKREKQLLPDVVVRARVIHADLLRRTGKLDDAIRDMSALFEAKPASSTISVTYADILLQRIETTDDPVVRQNSVNEAKRVIQEAEKHPRGGSELDFYKSRLLIASGEPTEAVSLLSKIIDRLAPLEQGVPFTVRCYYYLGKAKLFYVDQARQSVDKTEQALEDARKSGDKNKTETAVQDKQAAEESYAKLAAGAKSGLEDLSEAVYLMHEVRSLFPVDERKMMDSQLIDAQTIIVQTMMARGELADTPERLVQALTVNLDNDLVYRLLAKAIEKEKDPDKSRRLTANAVYSKMLANKYDEACVEAEKAIAVYGTTPAEAVEALKTPKATPEQIQNIRDRISGTEELQAIAGITSLLQNKTEAGMAHFQQACQLHAVSTNGPEVTPQAYAQQIYARLVWTLYSRSLADDADRTLETAIKQFPNSDTLMLSRAGLAAARGRLGSAVEACQRAIQLSPKRGEYYTHLATLYLDLGMNDEARKLISQIPADVPRSGSFLIELVETYTRLRDVEQSRKLLSELLNKFGSDPVVGLRARLVAASYYLDAGDFAEASKLVAVLPSSIRVPVEFDVQRAGIFMNAGDLDKAAQTFVHVRKDRPDDLSFFTLGMLYLQMDARPDASGESERTVAKAQELAQTVQHDYREYTHARLLLAVSFFQNDKTASAVETLKDPFVEGRNAAFDENIRQRLLSVFLLAQGDTDAAFKKVKEPTFISNKLTTQLESLTRDMLAKISKLSPDQRNHALKALARGYLAPRGQLWALSASNWQELAQLLPDDPVVALNLAAAYGNNKQSARARALLSDNLKKNPDFIEGWRALGVLCDQNNDLAGAEAAFSRVVALADDASMVCVRLGEIYERDGKGPQAVPLYESVVSRSDRFPNALNNLAYHLITDANPDLERGVAYAKKAVEFAPYEANYHDTLGWAYYVRNDASKNDPDLAIQELEKAVKINPGSPEMLYHLAMAHLKRSASPDPEQKKKAADSLREALSISPLFPSSDSARTELQKLSSN